jgi:hypothetical protein
LSKPNCAREKKRAVYAWRLVYIKPPSSKPSPEVPWRNAISVSTDGKKEENLSASIAALPELWMPVLLKISKKNIAQVPTPRDLRALLS